MGELDTLLRPGSVRGRPSRRLRAAPVVALVVAPIIFAACARLQLRSPIASPASAAPATFLATTSDVRTTRIIDVRDGLSKSAAFRSASDLLAQKYSIDVSDAHAGYLMTPWQASLVRGGVPDLRYRTRVIVRFVGDDWKQVAVRAEANWQPSGTDEWRIGSDTRLLDDVGNDLAARIGKR
jgi:hypothetical protein